MSKVFAEINRNNISGNTKKERRSISSYNIRRTDTVNSMQTKGNLLWEGMTNQAISIFSSPFFRLQRKSPESLSKSSSPLFDIISFTKTCDPMVEEKNKPTYAAEGVVVLKRDSRPFIECRSMQDSRDVQVLGMQQKNVSKINNHYDIIQCKTRNLAQFMDGERMYRLVQTRSGARIVDFLVSYNQIFNANDLNAVSLYHHLECLCEMRRLIREKKHYAIIRLIINIYHLTSEWIPFNIVEEDIETELKNVVSQFCGQAISHFHRSMNNNDQAEYIQGCTYRQYLGKLIKKYEIDDPLYDSVKMTEMQTRWILNIPPMDSGEQVAISAPNNVGIINIRL